MQAKRKDLYILGEYWGLYIGDDKEFPQLKNCDGYTDKTARCIVVIEKPEECSLKYFERYQRKVIRHEIIHAFLFESGLHSPAHYEAAENEEHPEMMVDWVAVQFPKLLKVFKDAGALTEGEGE